MSDVWNTSISVGIHRDCPMEFRIQRGGVVEFWACRGTDEFDLSFELDAMRRFLELGTSAVTEAEALVAAERTNSEDGPTAGHEVNRGRPVAPSADSIPMGKGTEIVTTPEYAAGDGTGAMA